MFIPIAASLGVNVPFGIGCSGASIGSFFGPIGIVGGVVLGGVLGCVLGATLKGRFSEYTLSFKVDDIESCVFKNKEVSVENDNSADAQAPGKPTEKDGFIPPKNGSGEKVRHRRGHGWPDRKGNVWIPSGPNGHGGLHWDVQYPDGSYDNVVPGGGIRGKK